MKKSIKYTTDRNFVSYHELQWYKGTVTIEWWSDGSSWMGHGRIKTTTVRLDHESRKIVAILSDILEHGRVDQYTQSILAVDGSVIYFDQKCV